MMQYYQKVLYKFRVCDNEAHLSFKWPAKYLMKSEAGNKFYLCFSEKKRKLLEWAPMFIGTATLGLLFTCGNSWCRTFYLWKHD